MTMVMVGVNSAGHGNDPRWTRYGIELYVHTVNSAISWHPAMKPIPKWEKQKPLHEAAEQPPALPGSGSV